MTTRVPRLFLALFLLDLSGTAHAEGFELQQFRPACGDSDVLSVASAHVRPTGPASACVLANYADSPLRFSFRGAGTARVVDGEEELDAGLTFTPFDRLETTVVLPLAAEQLGSAAAGIAGIDQPREGIADVRLQAKTPVLSRRGALVAAMLGASIPTGTSSALRGHGGPVLLPALAGEYAATPSVRVLANAALVVRDDRFVAGLHVGDALRYGVGVESGSEWSALRLQFSLTGEAGLPMGGPARNPAEALAGIRYRRSGSPISFLFAAGPGLGSGYGSPRFRLVAGMSFGSLARQATPRYAEPEIATPVAVATPAATEIPALVTTTANQASEPVNAPAAPVSIDQRISFALGSTAIDSPAAATLETVAGVLRDHPEIGRVAIEGHADDQGDPGYDNAALSSARAAAVRDFLVNAGIDSSRLEAVGFGADRPLDPGHTPEAHAANRRVEFRILDAGVSKP